MKAFRHLSLGLNSRYQTVENSDQLGVLRDNLSAANSNIKDVDVAQESTRYARYNILVQAGTAMLAQANATPQTALRLLQ
jgi:flagellin